MGEEEKVDSNQKDWWNSISAEERMSIERGLDDSENGRVTPHSEIRKRYDRFLTKLKESVSRRIVS